MDNERQMMLAEGRELFINSEYGLFVLGEIERMEEGLVQRITAAKSWEEFVGLKGELQRLRLCKGVILLQDNID